MKVFTVADAAAMDALGETLARAMEGGGAVVYLCGELGAGKTTLVRGVLRGLGYTGRVRSPTYTLVEGYETPGHDFYHLDLYRIAVPGELEFLGVRELDDPAHRLFIEWPERGGEALPKADLEIRIQVREQARSVSFQALSERGRQLAAAWESHTHALRLPGIQLQAGGDSKVAL